MNICFLDFETTGVNVFYDEPIQIGAILVNEELEIIGEFSSLINIDKEIGITQDAFLIHGMNRDYLKYAPSKAEVLKSFFINMGTDFHFAGWNISFDIPFMRKICHMEGFMDQYNMINYRHIDVQSIIYFLRNASRIPKNIISLTDTLNYYGVERAIQHNALEDARLTFAIFKIIKTQFK